MKSSLSQWIVRGCTRDCGLLSNRRAVHNEAAKYDERLWASDQVRLQKVAIEVSSVRVFRPVTSVRFGCGEVGNYITPRRTGREERSGMTSGSEILHIWFVL